MEDIKAWVGRSETVHDILVPTPVAALAATLQAKDIRHGMPRFEAANYAANLALLPGVQVVAAEAGCTMAQLALAWLLSRGPHVLAIPGTTSVQHLQENMGALQVRLSPAQLARLDALVNTHTVVGARYSAQSAAEVDTETF